MSMYRTLSCISCTDLGADVLFNLFSLPSIKNQSKLSEALFSRNKILTQLQENVFRLLIQVRLHLSTVYVNGDILIALFTQDTGIFQSWYYCMYQWCFKLNRKHNMVETYDINNSTLTNRYILDGTFT